MMEYSSNKTSLVSSSDKVAAGSGNRTTFNDSVPAADSNKTTFKTKHDLNESLPIVHRPNAASKGAVNALKNNVQRNPGAKQFRLNNTQVTYVKRKSAKSNTTPKEIVTNNGTVTKLEHVKAFKAKSRSN